MSSQTGETPATRHPRTEREDLRRRVIYERKSRGWTRAELTRRLTAARCPLGEQELYKLESPPTGRAPRVVKVDELAALAEVFDLPIERMLRPPEDDLAREVAEAVDLLGKHRSQLVKAFYAFDEPLRQLTLIGLSGDGSRYHQRLLEQARRLENSLISLVDIGLDLEEDLRSGAVKARSAPSIDTDEES